MNLFICGLTINYFTYASKRVNETLASWIAEGFVIISKVTTTKVSIIKVSVSKVIISKVSIRLVISSKVSISKVIIRKVSISIHVVSLNYQTIREIATIISKVSISKVIISIHKVSLNYQTNCQPGVIFTTLHFLHGLSMSPISWSFTLQLAGKSCRKLMLIFISYK